MPNQSTKSRKTNRKSPGAGFAADKERAKIAGRKGGIQKGINHRKKLKERGIISSK